MRSKSFLNYRDDFEKLGMKVDFATSPFPYYKITSRKWGSDSIYITNKKNVGDDAEYISNDNIAMGELTEIDVQKKGRTSTVTLFGGNKHEVRLAESISEENGANINVGILSPGEQQLAVGLIAMFGEKEGPRVDMKSLKYFKVNYLADIISKNMKHLSSDAKKYSAKLLKKLQKSIKEDSMNESSDLNFVLDQIANSMDHYDEKEFVDHISKETKYDAKSLKKLYQSYFKLKAMDRFQMGMDINKTKKFLKKFGIK